MKSIFLAPIAAMFLLNAPAGADTPSEPPAGTSTARPSAATPASPAAKSEAAETSAPKVTDAMAAERASLLQQAHAQGYRPRKHGEQTVYCKSEKLIGSRFEQLQCATEDQLVEIERKMAETQEEVARRMRDCAGSGCSSR